MSAGDVERLAEVLTTPMPPYGSVLLTNRRVAEILAQYILASDWLAAHDAEVEARALREAADDQESMLLDGMDGDFLLVDCGHFGHENGRVGLSGVQPTDVSRWARDWLRARADREGQGREEGQ